MIKYFVKNSLHPLVTCWGAFEPLNQPLIQFKVVFLKLSRHFELRGDSQLMQFFLIILFSRKNVIVF